MFDDITDGLTGQHKEVQYFVTWVIRFPLSFPRVPIPILRMVPAQAFIFLSTVNNLNIPNELNLR
jgi:hypothetical protein